MLGDRAMTGANPKKLVVFDIDGTLTHTAEAADRIFLRTVSEFLCIPDVNLEWPDSTHGTDTGALNHLLSMHSRSPLTDADLARLQRSYLMALEVELTSAPAVVGADVALQAVSNSSEWQLSFATGNWLDPGLHKLRICGLGTHGAFVASSCHSYDRSEILREAISRSGSPTSVVYLGDKPWDKAAAEHLGIGFVAIGGGVTAQHCLRDYRDIDRFWTVLEDAAGAGLRGESALIEQPSGR